MGDVAVCPCGANLCLGAVIEQQEMSPTPQQLKSPCLLAPPSVSETRDCQENEGNNTRALDLIYQIEQLLEQAAFCPCGTLCNGAFEVPKKNDDELISPVKLQHPNREIYIERQRVPCPHCQKRFPVEKLEYHKKICFKYHQKRKAVVPYNATKHRLRDLSKSNRKRAKKAERPPKLTEIEWKEEHEEWKTLMSSDLATKKEAMFKDYQWKRTKMRQCKSSEYLREKGIISCPI
ncbi:uncharacterized protein LOC106674351 [Cimex lectularius]|uniref:Uncharacterized protein n=1 Tax=Cimex lectularius TaxID=79782 RepID=A0A8I6SR00_CIMLE|nr:uncharacterized protein LOC106674351 [Cimex lectularius]